MIVFSKLLISHSAKIVSSDNFSRRVSHEKFLRATLHRHIKDVFYNFCASACHSIVYCSCKARLDNPLEQNPNDKSLHTPKCKRFRKIGCLDVTKWKDRLETFNNHPSKELLNIRKIAENGFFYGEKNRIKCFRLVLNCSLILFY